MGRFRLRSGAGTGFLGERSTCFCDLDIAYEKQDEIRPQCHVHGCLRLDNPISRKRNRRRAISSECSRVKGE